MKKISKIKHLILLTFKPQGITRPIPFLPQRIQRQTLKKKDKKMKNLVDIFHRHHCVHSEHHYHLSNNDYKVKEHNFHYRFCYCFVCLYLSF